MSHVTIQSTAVPSIGFGTWQLTPDDAHEGVRDALDIGYRHIDTAQMYDNEEAVGKGLADAGVDREDVFLTTKVHLDDGRPGVREAAEASLRKLAVDYVDLYLIHWPTPSLDLAAALDEMTALRDQGKIRHLGVSNFPSATMAEAADLAPVFCNQVEYHPLLSQDRVLEEAARRDVLVTAYSPIAQGQVADHAEVTDIADAHGVSPYQVALRWLIQQDKVAAIPRSTSSANRRANLDVRGFQLSDEEMDVLHELAARKQMRLVDMGFVDWDER